MCTDDFDDEKFDFSKWYIRREGQQWIDDKFNNRIYEAPEKIEFVLGRIFTDENERLTVLAMLLENLGIDKAVKLGNPDWKAAVAALEE